MLLCSDEAKIKRARFLATQARDPARYYQHSTIGYNYRMSNVVAGIGRGQLLHLEEHKARKNEIYRQYKEAFADIEAITMNPMNPDGDANNWLSCMTIAPDCSVTPDQVMDALAEYNIETRPIWKPMHLQPVFADCDFIQVKEGRSVSEDIFNRGVCLPSDIKNTPEDMELIISLSVRYLKNREKYVCKVYETAAGYPAVADDPCSAESTSSGAVYSGAQQAGQSDFLSAGAPGTA